jgi:hypothetical protein
MSFRIAENYTGKTYEYDSGDVAGRILEAQREAGIQEDRSKADELSASVERSFEGKKIVKESDLNRRVMNILIECGQRRVAKCFILAAAEDNLRRADEASKDQLHWVFE